MDTDSFVLSVNTKDIVKDLKNPENLFDLSTLSEYHELFSNKNKQIIEKFKIETPNKIFIDEFIFLRSNIYAFKCGGDSRNKPKVFVTFNRKILDSRGTKNV